MSDIQSLIKMLQSDNHNKRYDACEELRVEPALPEEAIEALRSVLNDPSPEVVEAAFRALAIHTQIDDEKEQYKTITNSLENPPLSKSWWPLIGFSSGLIPGLIIFVWMLAGVNDTTIVIYSLCFGSIGISCGMLGAYIGRSNTKTACIAAVLVAILGVSLFFAFASFTCLLCQ